VLGMTTGAVRNRLSRGTLRGVEEHGTVYVLLPADTSSRDIGDIPGMSSALMSEMRDLIALLERKLEHKDAILLNIAEAMKAISLPTQEEEPSEPRESSVTPRDTTGVVGWVSRIAAYRPPSRLSTPARASGLSFMTN
jgi:hypothetical protein